MLISVIHMASEERSGELEGHGKNSTECFVKQALDRIEFRPKHRTILACARMCTPLAVNARTVLILILIDKRSIHFMTKWYRVPTWHDVSD